MADDGVKDEDIVYHLRDINSKLVQAWSAVFSDYTEHIKVSEGDIFEDGPAVDAIVSPANSFGFMDGGIDLVYSRHFGFQMQDRLQKVIREEYDGELLVGQAIIIPCYSEEQQDNTQDLSKYNEGKPIKYLISVPTMRVPADVSESVHAFLAFRAVILAVRRHNKSPDVSQIRSVLVPGMGTSVGLMPPLRCAWQMHQAYETYALGKHRVRVCPEHLTDVYMDHIRLCEEEQHAIPRPPEDVDLDALSPKS